MISNKSMRQIVALVTKYLWAGPTRVLYTLVSLLATLAACDFLIFNWMVGALTGAVRIILLLQKK